MDEGAPFWLMYMGGFLVANLQLYYRLAAMELQALSLLDLRAVMDWENRIEYKLSHNSGFAPGAFKV